MISWLEGQPRVLDNQVRPVIILDAADRDMRELASRRHEQSQFLTAWGAEMIRVHLHHIEKTELDFPPLRNAILKAAGGIPTGTVRLIREMRIASDPMQVAADWSASLRIPPDILKGKLGTALGILALCDAGDYEACNDLMREHVGHDLVDIVPDFLAAGLVCNWQPQSGRVRLSALGDAVAVRMNTWPRRLLPPYFCTTHDMHAPRIPGAGRSTGGIKIHRPSS